MAASRLRLCFVCESTAGGVRKHLRELMLGLPAERFQVSALLSDRGEPGFAADLRVLRGRGIEAEIVPMRREVSPAADLRALRRLKERLRALAPDVVHTHGSKGGFLGRLAASSAGVPAIVHTPHTFAFQWAGGLARRVYFAAERYAARRCHAFVAVGPSQQRVIVESGLAPPERVRLIENGIDAAALFHAEERGPVRAAQGLEDEDLVVGMVARLAPQKGVGRFVAAAKLVSRAEPRAVFLLIGGGPLEDEIRAQVSAAGIESRFRMLGHREEAEALYPAFDLFVLSSHYEGLPYVLLEAQAAGLAVVATDVPGTSDVIVDGETGLLIREPTPEAIAAAIRALLADPARREEMARAGRRRVAEKFTMRGFLDRHVELYGALAAQRS